MCVCVAGEVWATPQGFAAKQDTNKGVLLCYVNSCRCLGASGGGEGGRETGGGGRGGSSKPFRVADRG